MASDAKPRKPPDPVTSFETDVPLESSDMKKYKNLSNGKKFFQRYLELNLLQKDRREVNPFNIKKELEELTKESVKKLTGTSKYKLLIESRSDKQTKILLSINKICGNDCTVTLHPTFNHTKGLIRLRNSDIDDMIEFKEYLSQQFDIDNIEKASFIKSKYGETYYIITFLMDKLPYSVYIPGEITDTVVQTFKPRPMLCKSCQEYGHTAKKCKKNETRCSKCSVTGHKSENCTIDQPKCHHCKENHSTGSRNCQKEMDEQKLIDIIQKEKVTYQRARQILNPLPITRLATPKPTPFPKHFDVKLPQGAKQQIKNPWIIENAIKAHLGKPPRRCRGSPQNENTFVIEVATLEESRKMSSLLKIQNYDVTVQVNESLISPQKGLIYIQGYNMTNLNSYKEGLKKEYNLKDVEHATWIKPKNPRTAVLLLTFNQVLPEYIDIPGETMRTFVHEYIRRPNLCKKCLDYGHSGKICREEMQRCLNCSSVKHSQSDCNQPSQCHHCPKQHKTGDKNCQRYKVEEQLIAIQTKSQVSRQQAITIYQKELPINTNYAAAVSSSGSTSNKKVSNPTVSKKNETKRQNQTNPDLNIENKTNYSPNETSIIPKSSNTPIKIDKKNAPNPTSNNQPTPPTSHDDIDDNNSYFENTFSPGNLPLPPPPPLPSKIPPQPQTLNSERDFNDDKNSRISTKRPMNDLSPTNSRPAGTKKPIIKNSKKSKTSS